MNVHFGIQNCTKWYTWEKKIFWKMDENVQNDIRFGLNVHFNIQDRAEWYTILYKLIYRNVQNEIAFLKIVQFGIQNCTKWYTWEKKYFGKMTDNVQNDIR